MRNAVKKLFTSFLCLCLCMTAVMPVRAANTNGVTFQATLDVPTIQVSDQDQTVVMRVTASQPVALAGIGGTITWDDELTLNAITNDEAEINFNGCVNTENGKIDFYDANLTTFTDVTSIAVATFTVPANTLAGSYEVGMEEIQLVSWDETAGMYVAWESVATTTATLTITDSVVSENYTAGLSAVDDSVTVGETVSVKVNVTHLSDTVFAAGEIKLGYDNEKLAFNESASALNGATAKDDSANGELILEHYGTDKNLGDVAYTLVFDTKASGATTVILKSAAFGDKEDAETKNLTPATISTASVALTIGTKQYAVALPDIFEGPETVEEGGSYSFTIAQDGAYFDYDTVEATVGGEKVTVINNGDGSYVIENVTGELVITGNRTAKSYDVSVDGTAMDDLTVADTATYGSDFCFTMPSATDDFTYSLDSITIAGKAYGSYEVEGQVITIPGTAVTGDIVITVSKVAVDDGKVTIQVQGSGAGAAAGYEVTIDKGADYTLEIQPESGYQYTVTATMNGAPAEVIDNGDNTYTVKNVTGNLVFEVTKTVVVGGVTVTEYLTLNGSIMWLVKNAATLDAGKVSTYDGEKMFWSEEYDAYCYLVVADTLSAEEAAGKVGITDATATAVDYGMDVNKTDEVDANDAQLTYNMYNAVYDGFTTDVSMEKFLRADTNGDGQVNTEDAVAIIAEILK